MNNIIVVLIGINTLLVVFQGFWSWKHKEERLDRLEEKLDKTVKELSILRGQLRRWLGDSA